MTLPYNAAEGDPTGSPYAQSPSPPAQDVVPRGERDQDQLRSDIAHDLTSPSSRPSTQEEQQAAEHDVPPSERVYAPASERVPKPPVPGHRGLVEHPDQGTPERQATQPGFSSQEGTVRTTRGRRRVRIPIGSAAREEADATTRQLLAFGLGWFGLFTCGAVGMWMYTRWRQQRNRPVSRLRRQARWAAEEVRDHVPAAPETSRTAMSVAAALLSTGVVVWRRMHASHEPEPLDDNEWQKRLRALRARWTPDRVQPEASGTVN